MPERNPRGFLSGAIERLNEMQLQFDFSLGWWWRVLLLLMLVGYGGGCAGIAATPTPPRLEPAAIPTLPVAPVEFSLTEVSLAEAEPYYQDPTSQEILSGIQSITQSGIKSVHILPRFGPEGGDLTDGVYLVMPPGEALVGYLRLVPTLTYSHEFGLLATLNYVPIPVEFEGQTQALPRLHLEPGRERVFRFHLPALPEGLYTLVLNLIIEPEHEFDISTPGESFDPAESETQTCRSATLSFAFGLLLWVTDQVPQSPLDWPEEARYLPPEETVGVSGALLTKEKPEPGEDGQLLTRDTVRAGETVTYYARFWAPTSTDTADIPVRTLVFWNDHPTQSDLLSISPEDAREMEYIPYAVQVPSHLAAGEHTLMVMAYPYPFYLRSWRGGGEWRPDVGAYGMPLIRIPVTVEEP
jgi:hypothetical protein